MTINKNSLFVQMFTQSEHMDINNSNWKIIVTFYFEKWYDQSAYQMYVHTFTTSNAEMTDQNVVEIHVEAYILNTKILLMLQDKPIVYKNMPLPKFIKIHLT